MTVGDLVLVHLNWRLGTPGSRTGIIIEESFIFNDGWRVLVEGYGITDFPEHDIELINESR